MSDEQHLMELYARCYHLLSEATQSLVGVPLEILAKAEWQQLAHIRSLCLDEMTRLMTPLVRVSLKQPQEMPEQ